MPYVLKGLGSAWPHLLRCRASTDHRYAIGTDALHLQAMAALTRRAEYFNTLLVGCGLNYLWYTHRHMRITRKTGASEIVAELKSAAGLKEIEAIARQCNPRQIFEIVVPWLSEHRPEVAEVVVGESAIVQLEVGGDEFEGGWWTFHIEDGMVRVQPGKHGRPDLGVQLDILTWEDLQSGDNDPPRAYTQGRIKFTGNPAIGVRVLGRLRKYL